MHTGPQRLVLIRSGCYEYAEVELTDSLQIVGPNNTGKTALINTLQFLYIDDQRRMDFGSYTAEQTRAFYFPNQYSYILFECLGATGKCVIGWRGQSKASGSDPERFLYAGPFDPSDFIDGKNQVRDPRDVKARLALKQFRSIKNSQEHKELLLPGSGEYGLGIISLRDSDKYHHFRETLKNLLTLSNISQEQMRDRLLMLADIPPDRTAFDARELFREDYDLVCARREQLLNFKKNRLLVEQLIRKFYEREIVRGELMWYWPELRKRRQTFEKEHNENLTGLQNERAEQEKNIETLEAEQARQHEHVRTCSVEEGELLQQLRGIEAQDKEFKGFPVDLERIAVGNLEQDVRNLQRQLDNAQKESRDTAQRNLNKFEELVKQSERLVAEFEHIVVTLLRRSFTDEELNTIFSVLNQGLLELPVGTDGVTVLRETELITKLRALLARTKGGVYRDSAVSFPLSKIADPLSGLENVNTARERLAEHQAEVSRWKEILTAIDQRDKLESQCREKLVEIDQRNRRLIEFDQYQENKGNEARLRAVLERTEESISEARGNIEKLSLEIKAAGQAKSMIDIAMRQQQEEHDRALKLLDQCSPPDFSEKPHRPDHIEDDFAAFITQFVKQQSFQAKLTEELAYLLREIEQCFGDQFNGADDSETIGNLRGELEALPGKEEALTRDWNALIQGLKATFDHVLRNLDHVRNAAGNMNREFAKVQVSNLKLIRLEVIDQSEIVGWIKRLATFDPGGLFETDPQQQAAIANFRRKLQDHPVIRFTDLFTLGVTVVGADDQRHTYHDFRQIESHGTTITVKVLFNLLLLKSQLRHDDCAVPFFLDEIQTLDPANRDAILRTARQLRFIAITAAPEAISEVDALYFIQPHNGRIILRNKHRLKVRRTAAAAL